MTIPDFAIVGAMKSATSSLFSYLGQHPAIFAPHQKEPHFFIDEDSRLDWEVPAEIFKELIGLGGGRRDEYIRLYSKAQAGQLTGDGSVQYLPNPQSPYLLFKTNPHCKIVISLREPVSRAYSAYTHNLTNYVENIQSFATVVSEELSGKRDNFYYTWRYLYSSYYAESVERWINVFGRDNVYIVFYDNIVADASAVVTDIFQFLGLSSVQVHSLTTVNPTGATTNPILSLLRRELTLPSKRKNMIKNAIPAPVTRALKGAVLEGLKRGGQPSAKLDSVLKSDLTALYRDDVQRLRSLGVNVPYAWGY
jgi:hypothetical protein